MRRKMLKPLQKWKLGETWTAGFLYRLTQIQTTTSRVLLRHTVYDSKGQEYTVPIELTKTGDNEWTWMLAGIIEDSSWTDNRC